MRSANEQDVARAKATGKLEENVMYMDYTGVKFHGKKCSQLLSNIIGDYSAGTMVIAERQDGMLAAIDTYYLEVEKKGPAQQPKKPRRKPVKGAKPETKIPMSADVQLEVGDVVLLENGKRERVQQVDGGGSDYPYLVGGYWLNTYGMVSFHSHPWYEGESITHKIIPWQEQQEKQIELKITPEVIKDIGDLLKSPAQEAFEAGFWVPHIALPDSQVPSFAVGEDIEALLAGGRTARERAERFLWGNKQLLAGAEIVAYRKAR